MSDDRVRGLVAEVRDWLAHCPRADEQYPSRFFRPLCDAVDSLTAQLDTWKAWSEKVMAELERVRGERDRLKEALEEANRIWLPPLDAVRVVAPKVAAALSGKGEVSDAR